MDREKACGKIQKETSGTSSKLIEINENLSQYIRTERNIWSVLSDNLDADSYGGMYMKDGKLHIKVIKPLVQNLINKINLYVPENFKRFQDNIVLEYDAIYSFDQLEAAVDNLWKAVTDNKLELISTAICQKLNGIIVEAENWTEDKKTLVSEISGINMTNLKFEYSDGIFDSQQQIPENNNIKAALTDAMPGSLIINQGNSRRYSLGAGVWYQYKLRDTGEKIKKYGWITAGHNCSNKDKFTMSIYNLGKVSYVATAETVKDDYSTIDAAIIDETSITQVDYSLETYNGKLIVDTDRPIQDEPVHVLGGMSALLQGKITSTSYTINWNGDAPGLYKRMIKTNIVSQGGDSGAPLLRLNSDGTYTLLGILKGRQGSDNLSIFSAWRYIAGGDFVWIDDDMFVYFEVGLYPETTK